MSIILHIETTTHQCAVALSKDGILLANRTIREDGYSHAEKLLPFIDEVVLEARIVKAELGAVSVSGGPGSYTGLRIGIATAKGICHALGIPLISVDTLTVLVHQARKKHSGYAAYVPMLDARRMEVYTRTFNEESGEYTEIKPVVIEDSTGYSWDSYDSICFYGDGAVKCSEVLKGDGRIFIEDWPTAEAAIEIATLKAKNNEFEGLALYEPKYLKAFKAGKAKDPFGLRINKL
ncbi:MAG: tRNA (adenosine(37)-N6)-threonylcarbamoyltransferase complex dimerization subunit type 1 TsaB [Bacteroidetes bacterium]|nr:MAG: tRNA (adenosine(37)-N6)-threonylcarbamoyltransferase complex dimerization subunit type 1 TsaB [Bacteroidota bacterium]